MHPLPDFSRKYDLVDVIRHISESGSGEGKNEEDKGKEKTNKFAIGAGAGPFHIIGQNSELIPDLTIDSQGAVIKNNTTTAKITTKEGIMVAAPVSRNSTDCALMANLFLSNGEAGDVLKVATKGRHGTQKSFSECIRQALAASFGERVVSLGGIFLMNKGTILAHVMPDFSSEPLEDKDMLNWLKFFKWQVVYEGGEMRCLSTLHSRDPGLGLRMEHTHFYAFGETGAARGGHYHGDVGEGEEAEVEYEGYFNVAREVWRVDRPGG